MITIALPKGRLGNSVYRLLSEMGYDCESILEDNRKLIFENVEKGVRYLLIKPSDVSVYVEHGAADIGIVGKDVLLERNSDVYELFDLGLGKCRMCVAAPNGYSDDLSSVLRVATKYPNIARDYYKRLNRDIEIIKLNGSIEIAPIVGLSDVIVDLVETGSTLKENDLSVYEEIVPISARFIANKGSYKFKTNEISEMIEKLRTVINDKNI